MEKSTRGICILQLCIVFALLAWICSYPFMGELLTIKTKTFLLQDVMGIPGDAKGDPDRLARNAERFSLLPESQNRAILERYRSLQEASQTPFWIKSRRMLTILLLEISPFELLWIIFGIAVPILVLLGKDGSRHVVWLLPALALAFAVDNQLAGRPPFIEEDERLVPSEARLIKNFMDGPLSADIFEQYRQFKQAWQRYLIQEWAKESPSPDQTIFNKQIENGEYAFNLARAENLSTSLYPPGLFRTRKHMAVLLIYLVWNLFFAIKVGRG